MRAPEYYGSQTEVLQTIIKTIGGIIAILMGVGAVFGAVITMYTAVASRTRGIATMNFQSFSQIAFKFAVTPQLLGTALFYALIMGLIGGMLPAIRAARLPVV